MAELTFLTLRWPKKRDGDITFQCLRADGSATWQRGEAAGNAGFFVHHDLGHYAVETTLNLRRAFYGLVASGWDFGDFGSPWPRGPFPEDAWPEVVLAESLAGALDAERAGCTLELAEFNSNLAVHCAEAGRPLPHTVTEEEIQQIRECHAALLARWDALPRGETLELRFPG